MRRDLVSKLIKEFARGGAGEVPGCVEVLSLRQSPESVRSRPFNVFIFSE